MRLKNLMILGFLLLQLAPGYATDVAVGRLLQGGVLVKTELMDTPFLEISLRESNDSLWSLLPSSSNRKDLKLLVLANRPWKLIIKDADPETSGRLTEWNGQEYTNTQLSNPLTVVGSKRVVLPNLANVPVQTGDPTNSQGQDVSISLEQEVSEVDSPLPPGSIYYIKMSFTLAAE